MQRTFALRLVFIWGTAFMLLSGASRTPLQPEQHVYPDSTLAEIQQAIDNGGTVYFEYLTRQTRQYAEYNQIASASPDLPASPTNPPKGFNIGANGKDVDIIGVLGDNGERPRINGGVVPFRIGIFPGLGFAGLPVNFRIENLELYNPDMNTLNWRIGIWAINVAGSQSTINNCKITITGKDTDPGNATNHSVAIWFYLGTDPQQYPGTQRPPSGARIDVTNNVVTGVKVHEGIHVDSFWPAAPDFTVPRAFVSNNTVSVTNLGGYPNKSGINGATIGTAILLAGNLSNSIVSDNIITGDGRSPGLTPAVEAVGIGLYPANSSGDTLDNVSVVGNNLSIFYGDFQMWLETVAANATVARNSFGAATVAGVRCLGDHHWFLRNYFYGPYLGWTAAPNGPGLFWFTNEAHNYTVEATTLNGPRTLLDICDQVRDEAGGRNKIIPGACLAR